MRSMQALKAPTPSNSSLSYLKHYGQVHARKRLWHGWQRNACTWAKSGSSWRTQCAAEQAVLRTLRVTHMRRQSSSYCTPLQAIHTHSPAGIMCLRMRKHKLSPGSLCFTAQTVLLGACATPAALLCSCSTSPAGVGPCL